jgi:hypothetical protein
MPGHPRVSYAMDPGPLDDKIFFALLRESYLAGLV